MTRRPLLALIVALGFTIAGFVLGALVGALLVDPDRQGLQAVGLVLASGLFGAGLGLLTSAVVSWRSSARTLRRAAAVSGVIAVLGIALVGYRAWVAGSREPAAASSSGDLEPRPLRSSYMLEIEISEVGARRRGLEMSELTLRRDSAGATVVWITHDENRPLRCEAPQVGLEPTDVADRLRTLAIRVTDGRGCEHGPGDGPILYRITWRAAEGLGPLPTGEVVLGERCFREFGAARSLLAQASAVAARAEAAATCGPDTTDLAALEAPR